MTPKGILAAIGLLNAGWLIFEGIYVLVSGRYFGSERPGPWATLVSAIGIDPFGMGIPFVALGAAWLIAVALLIVGHPWRWHAGLMTVGEFT